MGCGIVTRLNLNAVGKVIFVAPTAGNESLRLYRRYGSNIVDGKLTVSTDGRKKYMSKEYVASMQGIVWEDEYRALLDRYHEVYVFEAENEEIVGEDRFALRKLPFAGYTIIPGATHNLHGEALERFIVQCSDLL